MNYRNTLIIGVFGEVPYAEAEGDVNIPFCRSNADLSACLYNPYINPYIPADQKNDLSVSFNKFESEVITEVRALDKNIPLLSVLLTGRPVPIRDIYEESTAVIAAWLPGTSGGKGVMDAITGEYVVRKGGSSSQKNSLSVDWPRTQVPVLLLSLNSIISPSMVRMARSPRCLTSSSQRGTASPQRATPCSNNDLYPVSIMISIAVSAMISIAVSSMNSSMNIVTAIISINHSSLRVLGSSSAKKVLVKTSTRLLM